MFCKNNKTNEAGINESKIDTCFLSLYETRGFYKYRYPFETTSSQALNKPRYPFKT